jgi:hypothetical protein
VLALTGVDRRTGQGAEIRPASLTGRIPGPCARPRGSDVLETAAAPSFPGSLETSRRGPYAEVVARSHPSGSPPELPPDLPPEYAEAYLAGFRRAYDEAHATLATPDPAIDPGPAPEPHADVVEGHVVDESTEAPTDDETRSFEPVPPWAFEPPETGPADEPPPTPEWAFEPPGAEDPLPDPSRDGATDEEPADGDTGEIPAQVGGVAPDEGAVAGAWEEEQSWVVPGFALRDEPDLRPLHSGEETPQWIALAVLVCVAAVVLALLLVIIF